MPEKERTATPPAESPSAAFPAAFIWGESSVQTIFIASVLRSLVLRRDEEFSGKRRRVHHQSFFTYRVIRWLAKKRRLIDSSALAANNGCCRGQETRNRTSETADEKETERSISDNVAEEWIDAHCSCCFSRFGVMMVLCSTCWFYELCLLDHMGFEQHMFRRTFKSNEMFGWTYDLKLKHIDMGRPQAKRYRYGTTSS